MNTPKPFNPVVPMPEPHGYYLLTGHGNSYATKRPQCAIPEAWKPAYTAAQLRAYAAEVARAMVPDYQASLHEETYADGVKDGRADCRAATLSAIDEWEKNA